MFDALRLAQLEEEKNVLIKNTKKFGSNRNQGFNSGSSNNSSSSIEKIKYGPGSSSQFTTPSNKMKKLSSQEYKGKREKGLCFYCNEKYTSYHKCKNQKVLQLQIISEDGEEETDWVLDEEEELEVNQIFLSLNSIGVI